MQRGREEEKSKKGVKKKGKRNRANKNEKERKGIKKDGGERRRD